MTKVANRIALELSYPEEKRQVIEYGLLAIFQTVLMTVIVLALGAILHIFIEAAILCFAVSILRKYSGGAHASSMASCTIVGVIFCIAFGLAMKTLSTLEISFIMLVIASIIVFAFAFITAILRAPVDSPNKPIRTEQKKRRMKIGTLIVLFLYMLISTTLLFNYNQSPVYISALLSLLLSVFWQIGSLTGPGRVVLEGLDRVIYGIITFGRRTSS